MVGNLCNSSCKLKSTCSHLKTKRYENKASFCLEKLIRNIVFLFCIQVDLSLDRAWILNKTHAECAIRYSWEKIITLLLTICPFETAIKTKASHSNQCYGVNKEMFDGKLKVIVGQELKDA